MVFLLFLLSFVLSVIGSICGIGGGILLKPALDAMKIMDVAAVSFLSGCTVLSMSAISVIKDLMEEKPAVGQQTLVLGAGAAVGGVLGKQVFLLLATRIANTSGLGVSQSILLALLTLGTLVYTYYDALGKIQKRNIKCYSTSCGIGFALGFTSSFLGIGGGPMNLAVLSFFLSMNAKEAATNSLYIIFISQMVSLILSMSTGSIPEFQPMLLAIMIAGGVTGGYCGHFIRKRIYSGNIHFLFTGLLVLVFLVCIYNTWLFCLAL